jgi:hypothetical protein
MKIVDLRSTSSKGDGDRGARDVVAHQQGLNIIHRYFYPIDPQDRVARSYLFRTICRPANHRIIHRCAFENDANLHQVLYQKLRCGGNSC